MIFKSLTFTLCLSYSQKYQFWSHLFHTKNSFWPRNNENRRLMLLMEMLWFSPNILFKSYVCCCCCNIIRSQWVTGKFRNIEWKVNYFIVNFMLVRKNLVQCIRELNTVVWENERARGRESSEKTKHSKKRKYWKRRRRKTTENNKHIW